MPRRPRRIDVQTVDPNLVRPADGREGRQETLTVGVFSVAAAFLALSLSAKAGTMLLYGDAVAHLAHARAIVDTNTPGLGMLGGVWLPLPHLLMLPFIGRMEWWQNGMAGAWPSMICYVIAVMGMYRLARRMVAPRWALVATAFFGLNANLLYLSSTAMTEPLFLALMVWIVLLTMEFVAETPPRSMRPNEMGHPAVWRLPTLGFLILAATMTRYDGWILGAVVWCVVAWQLWKAPAARARLLPAFAVMTLLAVAGPAFWLWYNHAFAGDWLDFMRGPYSAKGIDERTSTPGQRKYWGWHNPAWSLMLYARTAQVDAAAWETGWLVAAAALWASWKAWQARLNRVWLLLWFPLPFYVYSISYGSVPIFIPQLYPHSFYNSRYGMEMLPVLAIFLAFALAEGVKAFGSARPQLQLLLERLTQPVMMMLVVVNLIVMLHQTPLVLQEARVNSRGRLALEEPMARQMGDFERGVPILMENSDHWDALQMAGIPLKVTIGPSDYYPWMAGMAAPAKTAAYVVSVGDDAVAQAVKAHPEGLTELSIVCAGGGSSGQKCVRFYQSGLWRK